MRFPLKEDYTTKDGEYNKLCGILTIKKGAPIWIALDWFNPSAGDFKVIPRFAFAGGVISITINELVLPEECGKDEWGNIFCVTHQEFCCLGGDRDQYVRHAIRGQMKYCPRCGKELRDLTSDLPIDEQQKFLVKERKFTILAG